MHNQKTASMLDNIINFNISGLVINDHWFPFKIDKAINYINNGSHFFFSWKFPVTFQLLFLKRNDFVLVSE